MTSADLQRPLGGAAAPARSVAFRPDIEGLRAVAIGLVLVHHAGVELVPGGFVGVDVFFVISGFLITGLLIRELESRRKISLARFYARRAKRLLPATGVVLLATTALTWWSVSVVDWRTFGWDIVGAAVYVVNWVLAGRSVDYLAEDIAASPVQHFWSLAVEEQFYIVWPLLLVAVGWLVRRSGRLRLRPVMTVGILLLIVPSFAWSVHLSATDPGPAFFVTTTRLWELGIGALVAIGATQWPHLPQRAATFLGWAGLGVVGLSGLVISSATTWPGSATLLPTLGTAAVIIAGFVPGRRGPAALLSWRPAVWVGGLSYSLYLWHWPLLVAATARWGELGTKRGLLVVAVAFLPAYLSYRFVENPIRFSSRVSRSNSLALSIGANFSLVGVLAGLALIIAVPSASPGAGRGAAGAAAIDEPVGGADPPGSVASLEHVRTMVPAPADATADVPAGYQDGCSVRVSEDDLVACEYGDPDGSTVVAVVGDSKVLQWQSALDAVALENDWRLVLYIKSACALSSAVQTVDGAVNESCANWNEQVVDQLTDLQPDVVVTSQRHGRAAASRADPGTRTIQPMEDGLVDTWQKLGEHGIPVIALLDNPAPDLEVYECAEEHPTQLQRCVFDRADGVYSSAAPTQRAAAERVPSARVLDLTDWICPAEQCVPVIGDILLYRQGSHLTDTWVRSMTPIVQRELTPLVEDLTG